MSRPELDITDVTEGSAFQVDTGAGVVVVVGTRLGALLYTAPYSAGHPSPTALFDLPADWFTWPIRIGSPLSAPADSIYWEWAEETFTKRVELELADVDGSFTEWVVNGIAPLSQADDVQHDEWNSEGGLSRCFEGFDHEDPPSLCDCGCRCCEDAVGGLEEPEDLLDFEALELITRSGTTTFVSILDLKAVRIPQQGDILRIQASEIQLPVIGAPWAALHSGTRMFTTTPIVAIRETTAEAVEAAIRRAEERKQNGQ